MQQNYYIATIDGRIADQWHLDAPVDRGGNELRGSLFSSGRPYDGPLPVTVPIHLLGRPLQVTFGDEKMVIVSEQAMLAIDSIAGRDCQFLEVSILGMEGRWHILNAIALVDCFDEQRSVYELQNAGEAGADPHEYDMVAKLVVDPARAARHRLFRVRGWDIDLIVSDAVKAAIESLPNHGVFFQCVTP